MERLTERHEYNGKNHISVDREKNGITCSNYCTNCGRADCDDIRNALYKLAEYEDLEEQGLLLRLPCNVGDTVYVIAECGMIPKQLDGTLYDENGGFGTATGYYCPYEDDCPHECEECDDLFDCDKFRQKSTLFEDVVKAITLEDEIVYISTENCNVYSQIGYAVFLTQAEAEEALRKMKESED